MTTPSGARPDEPIDGQVRQFLWRLRARLVTPPSEERVATDLDRLFAAAREHAHQPPEDVAIWEGRTTTPLTSVAGGTPPQEDGALVAVGSQPAEPSDASEPRTGWFRRTALVRVVGQAAAAAVIVAAVGVGTVSARDGVVRIEALLGRDGVPSVAQPAPSAEPADRSDVVPPGADDGAADPSDVDPLPPVQDPVEGVPEPTEPAPESDVAPEDATDGSAPAPEADGSSGTGSSGGQQTPRGSGAGGSDAPSGGASEPRQEREPEPTPEEAPSTEEVIAAPPSRVDGFGGPRPCDREDGLPCLPGVDDEDSSKDDAPADDGPEATPDEDVEDAEVLARRRFQGDG